MRINPFQCYDEFKAYNNRLSFQCSCEYSGYKITAMYNNGYLGCVELNFSSECRLFVKQDNTSSKKFESNLKSTFDESTIQSFHRHEETVLGTKYTVYVMDHEDIIELFKSSNP